MSLQDDLKKLQAQKKAELQNLHFTYLRTKREAVRAVNPGRVVRKHIGLSLGIAATLGLLLAPRPSPRYTKKDLEKVATEARKSRAPTLFDHVAQLLKNALGQLERLVPAPKTATTPSPAAAHFDPKTGKPTKSTGLLNTLLALLLSRLDLTKIAAQVTQLVMQAMKKSPAGAHNGKPHTSPNVSVADTGTVRPSDYENFQ